MESYPLDSITITKQGKDISHIPDVICTLYTQYKVAADLVDEYDVSRTTPAQRRTATLRFNKLVKAIQQTDLDLATTLFLLSNQ